MERYEIDQLYHLLRLASNIPGGKLDQKSYLMPQEQISVIYGLCRHLLAGGDYSALVQFSQFYGSSFLLEPTYKAIRRQEWRPSRIVELGAGLGWLGRGLAAKFGLIAALLVDKRPWPLINLVADLETQEGIDTVLEELKDGDIVVASDLLHCLDGPAEVMASFSPWPAAILEYCPEDDAFRESYSLQIARFGATPIRTIDEFNDIFVGRKTRTIDLAPYILLLVDPAAKPEE